MLFLDRNRKLFFLLLLWLCAPQVVPARTASNANNQAHPMADPYLEKKTHNVGNAWLTVTNYGFFGNQDDQRYPSFEFPGGSNIEYLFQGAVWVGALVDGVPHVSVGAEGWAGDEEFFPGTTEADSILVLSTRNLDPGAISEQDFLCEYSDAQTSLSDGSHTPLGIKIKQRSYAWSYSYAEDFIIIDYTLVNERTDGKSIESVYVGLYIDADCGHTATPSYAQDDITGFREVSINPATNDTFSVESAWIADGDGDFRFANPATGISGTRVVYPPMDDLSFNWWISDEDPARDYGPSWIGEFPYGPWQQPFGTPDDDQQKYYLMSNGHRNDNFRFDFEQELSGDAPSGWVRCSQNCDVIAEGEDTRYLFSFGPVGNFNNEGIRVLAPGDSAKLTIGYFAAGNFHRLGQDDDEHDFTDFDLNARWVKDVYDNPSYDTPTTDTDGDGVLDTGDGFFGEDVGCDGLANSNDPGEGDNILQDCEDILGSPDRPGYDNDRLELGDGVPDFNGPPPPLAPVGIMTDDQGESIKDLTISQLTQNGQLWVRIQWKYNSMFSKDIFSITDPLTLAKGDPAIQHPFFEQYGFLRGHPTDFEGYRIYKSTTGIISDYELLAEFDLIDHEFAAAQITDLDALEKYYLGYDIGFGEKRDGEGNLIFTSEGDSLFTYYYGPVAPNWRLFFAVTAFDHGIPAASVPSLESSPNSNAQLVKPSPDPDELPADAKPMVVPNPYRIDMDYTNNSTRFRWDDWNNQGFSEHTRRIDFINLPAECTIRVYTLYGDLVNTIEHGIVNGQKSSAESWDMITRNRQSLASGVYLFSVDNKATGENTIGKFVVIR